MANASDSTPTPTRRQFFGSAAGAGLAAAGPPIFTVAAPSALALACDWAAARYRYLNENDEPDEAWPNSRLDEEVTRYNQVVERAADEPAASPADLAAKARLLLCEIRSSSQEAPLCLVDRAIQTLLREVAALSA